MWSRDDQPPASRPSQDEDLPRLQVRGPDVGEAPRVNFEPPLREYPHLIDKAVAEMVRAYHEAIDTLYPIAEERGCGIRVRWFCVYTGKIQMEAYVDYTVPMGHVYEDRQM